jgi:hypothetical protein
MAMPLPTPVVPKRSRSSKTIDEIERCRNFVERQVHADQMVSIARRLLKTEWVRIKTELQ